MRSVSEAIIALFRDEMFYAELISQMRRVINYNLPSVAGVCIRDGIELHINPKFAVEGVTFDMMPVAERVDILKHECEHILRDHISRAKVLAPEVFEQDQGVIDHIINSAKHQGMNVSMDLAINGGLPNFPKWGCFPETFGLPKGETFEWYHQEMQQNEKAKKKMQEMTGIDPHALWKETKDTKEVIKEKIKQAVNTAAKATRAAGKMTSEQEMAVEEFNKTTEINWKQIVRRFVAQAVETKVEASRKKRNRRYGIHIPGSIKTEELHIAVAKDSSGSVSDKAYQQFMVEISHIAKYAKITMIDADCEVKNVEEFKKGMSVKRKGYGGTAYKPAFDFFNKDKTIDALLYFGDMDTFDKEVLEKPKYPVLWCIVGDQPPPADFGSQVKIKVLEEE